MDDAHFLSRPDLKPGEGFHAVGTRGRERARHGCERPALHPRVGHVPGERRRHGAQHLRLQESRYLLDAIASRGHQGVIRFYLDYPGRTTGMPRYLLDAGTDTIRQYDLHGNNKISFSPNYDEPGVQEMMLRFVATLGEK